MIKLMQGDCLDRLKELPDNSADSIVTDPPYGLNFMDKDWDHGVPGDHFWREALRVAKPGAMLLAFGGTRTFHRLAVAIEDAGWELRDNIEYLHDGSLPAGAFFESLTPDQQQAYLNMHHGQKLMHWAYGSGFPKSHNLKDGWQGWGTALKPAYEPIIFSRKPIEKGLTVAANVLKWGTGALNIDACRVPGELPHHNYGRTSGDKSFVGGSDVPYNTPDTGRWPANIIHDGSDDVMALFPANAGASAPVKGTEASKASVGNVTGKRERVAGAFHADKGSAARFFYCAKASRKDRNEGLIDPGPQFKHGSTLRKIENAETQGNNHPTVKPTELMRYLCRLVTPPGGVVLDPFMGSGSTGKAAMLEGFKFIGIERDADYLQIAEKRIAHAKPEGEAA